MKRIEMPFPIENQIWAEQSNSILTGMHPEKRERLLKQINNWPEKQIESIYMCYKEKPLAFIVADGKIVDIVTQ